MKSGRVHLSVRDGIASVLFDRPQVRNAMTWEMYDQLAEFCEQIRVANDVRVVTLRGAGGEAFVAGTDIEQFRSFKSGDDGIAYEREIDERIRQIESLPMPTVAIIDGWAIGGGLAIAAACDFRVATPTACFGAPIARTVGNCLSMSNVARVYSAFGVGRAKRMLLLGENLNVSEALSCGFVTDVAEPTEIDARVEKLCDQLVSNAPLTMRAGKESLRRFLYHDLPQGDDLIRSCYGSEDFKIGIEAFMAKMRPCWTGR